MADAENIAPRNPKDSEAQQTSLRESMLSQLAAARSGIEGRLKEIAGTNASSLALRSQLDTLRLLSQSIGRADAATLVALQGEVAATASAAQADAQSAPAGGAITTAEYNRQTAALDRRAARALSIDQEDDDDAQAMAVKYGVDLKKLDEERRKLEAERQAAISAHDEERKRQAELAIAQNTKAEMDAVAPSITDPADRGKFDQERDRQNAAISELADIQKQQHALEQSKAADSMSAAHPVAGALNDDAKAQVTKAAAAINGNFTQAAASSNFQISFDTNAPAATTASAALPTAPAATKGDGGQRLA